MSICFVDDERILDEKELKEFEGIVEYANVVWKTELFLVLRIRADLPTITKPCVFAGKKVYIKLLE